MKDSWRTLRVAWAVVSVCAVQSIVFGAAALPAVLLYEWCWRWSITSHWLRVLILGIAVIPAYLVFAMALIALSAGCTRMLGWRTPPDAEMRIEHYDWPLLAWVRYMVSMHVVRAVTGPVLLASPLWTMYLRLNGARIGRGVYINSLTVTDHNLLEIGDHTVIGAGVHMSGHTVEAGVVKTARLRIGRDVTVGVETVLGLGVEIGDGCQVGALSFVPKFTRLESGRLYVGIPVHPLEAVEAGA